MSDLRIALEGGKGKGENQHAHNGVGGILCDLRIALEGMPLTR